MSLADEEIKTQKEPEMCPRSKSNRQWQHQDWDCGLLSHVASLVLRGGDKQGVKVEAGYDCNYSWK